MNISKVDLNLLVYLDVLLRERNVTPCCRGVGNKPAGNVEQFEALAESL